MSESQARFEALVHRHAGQAYLVPCLDLSLYLAGDVFDHAAGIIRFVELAAARIGPQLKFFRTETMTAAKPLKADSLTLPRFWFSEATTRRDVYTLNLESGAVPDAPSDAAIALEASPGRGCVRLILPAVMGVEDPTGALELALELARPMAFDFGTFGFGVNWNPLGKNRRRAELAMHNLAPRYLGMDMSYPLSTKYIVTQGIKSINWVTFLGQALLDRKPAVLTHLRALPESVARIYQLDAGIAVQVGAGPSLGDVNRKEALDAYLAVGRICAPLRAPDHAPIFGPGGVPDEEETRAWLARFDV